MRSVHLTFPAVLVSALLLTACGSQTADSHRGGSVSQTQEVPGDSSCVVPTISALPGSSSDLAKLGVKLTGVSPRAPHCAAFEVTNSGIESVSYSISFAFLASSGEAFANPTQPVLAVKPGQTVRGTVTAGELPSHARDKVRVKITKVRSVPTDEVPSRGGSCPPSGMHMYADNEPELAMGLRILGLHLVNCGTRVNRLNGYPRLQLLDEGHEPVHSVKVLQDSSAITIAPTGADGMAQPMTLKPGERAYANLVWRNTVDAGSTVNSPYVRIWAEPGAAPVMLTAELDLGTTGKLGVGPWKKDETVPRPHGRQAPSSAKTR